MALPSPPAHPRRLAFLGTPAIAVPPLEALAAAGFDVALVVTGPDRRRGRGGETSPTPVKVAARRLGIEVSHDAADAATVGADLGVVVAFGELLRRPLLEALPMVNVHYSLLPRWRGAAPVERAILAGDATTGVCVMAVEEGLDTGGVHARRELAIRTGSTAAELSEQLTQVGARLLVETLQAGLGAPEPQVGESTYAAKLTRQDRELVWARPARELDRVVRVGGAWTTFRGRGLKVHAARPVDDGPSGPPGSIDGTRVATGRGALQLLEVQAEGKARQPVDAWAAGARIEPGELLGDPS
ncbi:MAG: hypothetical protein KDA97_11905 [Acidimicrobiales bacterium]|nr:hypothetical protein [Acidimicrobiales bacterium]